MDVNVKLKRDEGKLLQDPTLYRKLVGSLIYQTITRPNISFVVHIISKFMQNPRHLHLTEIQWIIKYLLSIPGHGLFFPAGALIQLQAYSNADWVGCPDTKKSTTGWCMFLGDAPMMQSYPPRALDRRLQEDWVRDTREDPRVLMSHRVDFGLMS